MITTIAVFLLVLGFLIFIHELGHYAAARHAGVRVEQFSIGFPPKLWGKKVGETEYLISWIPVGGYVRLWGQNLNDENEADPENYASKSIFQRFYILVAGPSMNLLFAFLFMPLVYMIGVNVPKYLNSYPVVFQVSEQGLAQRIGLQPGDEIVSANGKELQSWQQLYDMVGEISPESTLTLVVSRNGYLVSLKETSLAEMERDGTGWTPHIEPVVGSFSENSQAESAGLQLGDRIIRINGKAIEDWSQITETIQTEQNSTDKANTNHNSQPSPLNVEVDRNGTIMKIEVIPLYDAANQRFLMGMGIEMTRQSYGPIDSVIMGSERLWFVTRATFSFMGKLFSGQGTMNDVGGPVRIGQVLGDAARNSITDLFFLVAVISLQLGIFNLFPIPVLDGGHIFFLLLEKIKGGPLNPVFRERIQMVGMSLLMLLMIVITYHDILQLK
ncbi:MAG: RIP metalloprotease RseP [SAR324 cluster bacterium]|nr:RIP metalloprotease RseP [SAR324 cluster bacterium]